MDVTKYVRRWLINDVLAGFDDIYEGTIVAVVEEEIRNRFTGKRPLELVLVFADGWKLVSSLTARRSLVGWWGTESDDWLGRTIQVVRKRIERTDRKTGEVKVRYERVVACRDIHARASVASAAAAARTQPDVVPPDEPRAHDFADYDDSDEAIAAAARKKP